MKKDFFFLVYVHGNDCYDLVFFLKRGKKEQPAPEMSLWIISLSVRACVLT